jgi:hypothetical protein
MTTCNETLCRMNVCRVLGVVGSADFHQAKHALEVSHLKAFDKKGDDIIVIFIRCSVVSIQSSFCLEVISVSL